MPLLQMRKHPDNDITIINCNRCGCPPHAHVVLVAQQQQEAGADSFSPQHDSQIATLKRLLE